MSVGVCIINRNGIALAADSAGTFSGNKMFYNSMNKVFSLSRKDTYGAITYGLTSIYDVSIDQILKEFRSFLDGNNPIDDFFEIIPLFQEFIETHNDYYKFNHSEKADCISWIKTMVVEWGKKIKAVLLDENPESKIEVIFQELKNQIEGSVHIANFDISQHINSTYLRDYNILINIVVPELKKYPAYQEKLWEYICNSFNLSRKSETDNLMGLFFAGYGKKDAFPKFIHINIYKVIGGKLKFSVIEKFEESNNNAQIVPLAQSDVILTFCKGISRRFLNYIPQKFESIISKNIDNLADNFTDEQKQHLKAAIMKSKQELNESIIAATQKDNVDPILNSVKLIPLPEMAFLAENLVNITSLKRTFALDGNQQTVGGPTDVAVLSKSDGFIWIKRKLYFDSNINPNYVNRINHI